jgi:hypothetical protein
MSKCKRKIDDIDNNEIKSYNEDNVIDGKHKIALCKCILNSNSIESKCTSILKHAIRKFYTLHDTKVYNAWTVERHSRVLEAIIVKLYKDTYPNQVSNDHIKKKKINPKTIVELDALASALYN